MLCCILPCLLCSVHGVCGILMVIRVQSVNFVALACHKVWLCGVYCVVGLVVKCVRCVIALCCALLCCRSCGGDWLVGPHIQCDMLLIGRLYGCIFYRVQ